MREPTPSLMSAPPKARAEELTEMLAAWEAAVGVGRVVTAKELLGEAHSETPGGGALLAALEAVCPRRASARAVGKYLAKVKGRIRGGRRIVVVRGEKEGLAYRLEKPS